MTTAEKLAKIAENEQKVFDAGKKDEYDAFWDAFQDNGNRTYYSYAFPAFDKNTFRPKYDIKPTSSEGTFSRMNISDDASKVFDLAEHLKNLGITLDTSKSTSCGSMFASNRLFSRVPVIDVSSASSIGSMFANCSRLVTIDKFVINDDGSNKFNQTFTGCPSLVNLTIEGTIGQNGFDVSSCSKLSRDSYFSIFNALSDTTSGLAITLHSREAMREVMGFDESDELIDNSKPNWTIVFKEGDYAQ